MKFNNNSFLRLGIFCSHRGSNMQSVVNACQDGRLQALPSIIVSNNRNSGALEFAHANSLNWIHLSSHTHPDPAQLDLAILHAMQSNKVDLILLLGYMKKLGPNTIAAFRGRILNIHPALLPKYGGEGMYGLNVHKAVLSNHEKVTGVTIHLVDEQYDSGEILGQCKVEVLADDTAEKLAERVLSVEHKFMLEILQRICKGELLPQLQKRSAT